MKLFLVGPRFDQPQSNFPDFKRTAEYWRNLGHTVVSPAELDAMEGAHSEKGWIKPLDDEYISDLFRRDVKELTQCDAVILLENWKEDDQCQVLADIAFHCDMTAFENIGEDNYYHELDYENDEEYEFFPAKDESGFEPDTRFSDIIRKMEEMHNKKQKDYGKQGDPFCNVRASEDFGIPGWIGCIARGNDKMKRLQKFARGEELVNESVEDSFLDLAVYTIIAMILFQESNGTSQN